MSGRAKGGTEGAGSIHVDFSLTPVMVYELWGKKKNPCIFLLGRKKAQKTPELVSYVSQRKCRLSA